MPSFELSKLQAVQASRAVSGSDRSRLETSDQAGPKQRAEQASRDGVSLDIGADLNAANPPVDTERVEEIRKALKDGSYPLVPAKIVDAIIAVRVGFSVEQR